MKPELKRAKPFRVHARKFSLNYSNVPITANEDLIVNVLNREVPNAESVIGKEYHQKKNKHFYVVVTAPTKVDMRSCEKFNFKFAGKTHGYQTKGPSSLEE